MQFIRRAAWMGLLLLVLLWAGSARTEPSIPMFGAPASRATESAESARDGGFVLAQMLPFERNKVVPLDVRAAFLEGYEAYQRRDYLGAIGRMQLASTTVPDLADYALFYLGAAQRETGDLNGAAESFRRLVVEYPQSVLANPAGIAYANLELRLGRPDYALAEATRVVNTATDPAVEQNAQMVVARALIATNDFRGAYRQAQTIREKFPSGAADAEARALAYQILDAHPAVAATSSFEYHRSEAAILLSEGQPTLALTQIRAGLRSAPGNSMRAELTWLLAQASRDNPAAAKSALMQYLEMEPTGSHAAAALNLLAHIAWRVNDTASARSYFGRIVREFAQTGPAPEAMLEIGRTYEDDGNREAAYSEYKSLLKRFPGSEAATDARFRAPFVLYMMQRYEAAAAEFGEQRTRAAAGGERDMFAYWQARALERNGDESAALQRFRSLAASTDSNYYPALAAMRVKLGPQLFPAANAPDLAGASPPAGDAGAGFHLRRVLALRDLGLRGLEPPELRALAQQAASNDLRDFVLAEMQAAGAWHDAIQAATNWSQRGELNPLVAERVRYPRGYWEMVSATATRNDLDPFLVAALIRQESLYDPEARSGSDARGLMQLLPSTAQRYAVPAGLTAAPLDLYDPDVSLRLGTTYLRQLFAMFDGNMFRAVAAYNGGEHAVAGWVAKYPGDDDQWVENIGYRETREYVKKVIGGMREYRLLYQTPPPAGSNSIAPPPSQG